MPSEGVRQLVAVSGKGKPSRAITQVFDEEGAVQPEGRTEPGSQEIQLYDLIYVVHHFGVSRLAALFRVRSLQLVTHSEFETMKAAEDAGHGRELARLLALPDVEDGEENGGPSVPTLMRQLPRS